MTQIISKRHKLKFYLSLILLFLFLTALGTVLIVVFNIAAKKGAASKVDFMPVIAAGVYFFAFYTVYKYFKNAPVIHLDKDAISFNHQTFFFADLDRIELTGKQNFSYLIGFPMEAATLTFKNGETKYIFDDMYGNSWMLKSFLQQVVIDKKQFIEPSNENIDPYDLDTDGYETYNGNQITSMRGIILWGMIAFLAYLPFTSKKQPSTIAVFSIAGCCLFYFTIFSWGMNYFKVSQNYFVIKNQNFFWLTRAYRIKDIDEIVFETKPKAPNSLRVITKDFKNKLYLASTLRDKTWLEMQEKLESLGLKVRNECIWK
ncbi:MAG: hypothetical protein QM802_19255 [Agriterribacter sp.]